VERVETSRQVGRRDLVLIGTAMEPVQWSLAVGLCSGSVLWVCAAGLSVCR